MASYLEAVERYLGEGAWRERSRQLKRYLLCRRAGELAGWKDLPLEGVTRERVLAFLEEGRARGLAVGTVRLEYEALRIFFNWCVQLGLLPSNPCLTIRVPKAPPRRGVLPPAEVVIADRIREKVTSEVHRDAMLFALYTGLRQRTIRALRWEWIQPFEGHLSVEVPAEAMKCEGDFWVPLRSEAEAVLDAAGRKRGREGRIFPVSKSAMQAWWMRVRTGSSFPRMRLHDLRKAFATYLCRKGVSIDLAMRLTGHSTTKILLSVYREISQKEAFNALWT